MKLFDAIEDDCDLDAVRECLKRSPRNVHARSTGNIQPLHYAAWRDCTRIIALLLKHGARIEARGEGGWTPLHYAAHYDSLDAIKLLVKAGANMDAKDESGRTPVQVTTTSEVRRLLRRLGAKIDPETALLINPFAALSRYVKSGAKSAKKTPGLNRLMEFAIGSRNVQAVKKLLANGADPNADFDGRTPLILAVSSSNGNVEILDALIRHGADVNMQYRPALDLPPVTAISRAKEVYFTEAVKLLRKAGAKE